MADERDLRSKGMRHWLPNTSLTALRQEMNDLFENFVSDPLSTIRGEGALRVDMAETAEAVDVVVDVPGFKADEIQIDVADNWLTITAQHREEAKTEDPQRKFHRVERRSGLLSRSLMLPCGVDESRIDASVTDGVLKVHLPKVEAARRRTVPVRDGGQNQG